MSPGEAPAPAPAPGVLLAGKAGTGGPLSDTEKKQKEAVAEALEWAKQRERDKASKGRDKSPIEWATHRMKPGDRESPILACVLSSC